MSTEHDAKIETIQKLMAKANGTTNANEASIFMNKAISMMAEYGLDMEKVEMASIKEERVESKFSVSKPKAYELTLMHGIAESFGCKLLWQGNRSWVRYSGQSNYASFVFVGPKDRIKLASYAASVLGPQLFKARQAFASAMSKKIWANGIYDKMYDGDKAEVRRQVKFSADSFAQGWAWEIRKKVTKFSLNDKEQVLLDTYVEQNASPEEKTIKNEPLDHMAALMGRNAARDAHLHRPIEGGAEEHNLLGNTKQLSHG